MHCNLGTFYLAGNRNFLLGSDIEGRAMGTTGCRSFSKNSHCETANAIADRISARWAAYLVAGRVRFATGQKAFNFSLKYLWQAGEINEPQQNLGTRSLSKRSAAMRWTQSDDPA
jgi:hypothetical protein